MSSIESSSQSSSDSEGYDCEIEVESDDNNTMLPSAYNSDSDDSEDNAYAYADEPLADSEWLVEYEREVKANKDLEKKLQRRLDGTELVDTW